jgi:hypothetical protein
MPGRNSPDTSVDEERSGTESQDRADSSTVHSKLLSLRNSGVLQPGDQVTAKYKRDIFIAELDADGYLVVLGAREAASGADNSAEYQNLIGVRFGSPDNFLNAMVNLYLSRYRGRRGREKLDSWGLCFVQRQQKSLAELCRQTELNTAGTRGVSSTRSADGGNEEQLSEKRRLSPARAALRSRKDRNGEDSASSTSVAEELHETTSRRKTGSHLSRESNETSSSSSQSKSEEILVDSRRRKRFTRRDSSQLNASTHAEVEQQPLEKKSGMGSRGKADKPSHQARSSSRNIMETSRRRSAPALPSEMNRDETQGTDQAISSETDSHELQTNPSKNTERNPVHLVRNLWNLSDWELVASRMMEMLTLKPKALLERQEPAMCGSLQNFVEYAKSAASGLAPRTQIDEASLALFAAGLLQGIADMKRASERCLGQDLVLTRNDNLHKAGSLRNLKEHDADVQDSSKSAEADTTREPEEREHRLEARSNESERGAKRRKSELDETRSKLEAEILARQELELERRNLLVQFTDVQKLILREAKRRRILEEELTAERMTVNELNDRIDRIHLRLTHLLGVDECIESVENTRTLQSEASGRLTDDAPKESNNEGLRADATLSEHAAGSSAEVDAKPDGENVCAQNRSDRSYVITENQMLRARVARIEKELREWQTMLIAERRVRSLLTDAKTRLESDIGDLRIISERVHERKRGHREPAQKISKRKSSMRDESQDLTNSQMQAQPFSSLPTAPLIYGNENAIYDRNGGFFFTPIQAGHPSVNPYGALFYGPSLTQRNGIVTEAPFLVPVNDGWPQQEGIPPAFGINPNMFHMDPTYYGAQSGNLAFPIGMDQNVGVGQVSSYDPGMDNNLRMTLPPSVQIHPSQVIMHDPALYGYGGTSSMR